MTPRTWVLLGATSLIAEHFAHIAARHQHHLRLIGRNREQLAIIAQDIQLRFRVPCEFITMDFTSADILMTALDSAVGEMDLFIAQSDFSDNHHLTKQSINNVIQVNITTSVLFIDHYLKLNQKKHHLIYLSSVAACRGRAKNSLYGGSKAAVELYLEGLQQQASINQQITIARLGFIDTKQTYGVPGVFYAASPRQCAQACWDALHKGKRIVYYPKFWRLIMFIIRHIPFFFYKKMKI